MRTSYSKPIFFILISLYSLPPAFCQSKAAFESEYTDLAHCKKLAVQKPPPEAPGEGGSSKEICEGLEGYKVYVIQEHLYSHLLLKKGKEEIRLIPASTKVNVPVVSGSKLEWRYKTENGQKKLIGWIFRIAGEDLKNFDKIAKPLAVIRFETQSRKNCSLGEAETNEDARKRIDSDKTCE